MRNRHPLFAAALALAVVAPVAVQAHVVPGDVHYHGFADGLMHVATGLDHLAIAGLVGLWAAWRPVKAALALIALYGGGIALTGMLGFSGEFLAMDVLVAALAAGGVAAALWRAPLLVVGTLILAAAGLQGFTHGMAAAATHDGAGFVAGVTVATLAVTAVAAGLARRFSLRAFA
ncbi:MAG: hypothetical protein GC201_03895 [Alphaproteobacteria bacterium]|nr:hypothetical protein [Alphaproteobacteria bacterium]